MIDGKRVQELRLGRGWSVEQLAIQAGMSRDGVHKIEAGTRTAARPKSLTSLARALQTTPEYLLGLTDDPRLPDAVPVQFSAEQRQQLIAHLEAALAILR